jgi:hypothetical protein
MDFMHGHPGAGPPAGASAVSLPPPGEPSVDYIVLDPATLHLRREGNRLEVRKEGEEEWREATLVRLFPLTEPEHWVSVIGKDGKEAGIVLDLKKLSRDSLACAREELRRRYLVPQITRILACRDRADLIEWTVETDRGGAKFVTRNVREQVKEPLPRRLTIVDVEGNRYDVPDLDGLDPDSRRRLELQI